MGTARERRKKIVTVIKFECSRCEYEFNRLARELPEQSNSWRELITTCPLCKRKTRNAMGIVTAQV